MYIEMFNGWYFFWLTLCIVATAGLYFLLRHKSDFAQKVTRTPPIWGPGTNDAIGSFLAKFTPKIFRTVPIGQYAGQIK